MHTDFSPYAKLSYIEDVQAVRVQWFKLHMSLEEFQTICGAANRNLGTKQWGHLDCRPV